MKGYLLINWLAKLFNLCDVKIEYLRTKDKNEAFFAIPNCKNAKFILPLQNGLKGYWRGLDLYPAMLPKLVAKKSLMAISGLISPLLTKNHLELSCRSPGKAAQNLYELLSINNRNIDQIESFAVRKGSAGAGFKVIFQFQEKEGDIVSYIKVGDPVYRGGFLLSEKTILEYLNIYHNIVLTPKVSGHKENSTFSALEISPIKNIRYYPRPSYENVADLLGNLCNNTANDTKEITDTKKGALKLLDNYLKIEKTRKFVKNSLDYLSLTSFPRPLSHRDLAGWNLFFCKDGRIGILDWEFAKINHLPFQDLFHYLLHTTIHNTKLSPLESFKKVFEKSGAIRNAVDLYAEIIDLKDSELRRHLIVGYLWDWYSLESSRAGSELSQGEEYLEILNWLAEK